MLSYIHKHNANKLHRLSEEMLTGTKSLSHPPLLIGTKGKAETTQKEENKMTKRSKAPEGLFLNEEGYLKPKNQRNAIRLIDTIMSKSNKGIEDIRFFFGESKVLPLPAPCSCQSPDCVACDWEIKDAFFLAEFPLKYYEKVGELILSFSDYVHYKGQQLLIGTGAVIFENNGKFLCFIKAISVKQGSPLPRPVYYTTH